jgi:hypothetical protein
MGGGARGRACSRRRARYVCSAARGGGGPTPATNAASGTSGASTGASLITTLCLPRAARPSVRRS